MNYYKIYFQMLAKSTKFNLSIIKKTNILTITPFVKRTQPVYHIMLKQ